MKRASFLLAAVVLFAPVGKAQCLDSLGLEDGAVVSRCEQETLVALGGSWPHAHAAPPVVAFRYGNSAKAVDRSYFFQKLVLPWLSKGSEPSVHWYVLSAEERQRTGVDAIVVAWSKTGLTERCKRRVLHELEVAAEARPSTK